MTQVYQFTKSDWLHLNINRNLIVESEWPKLVGSEEIISGRLPGSWEGGGGKCWKETNDFSNVDCTSWKWVIMGGSNGGCKWRWLQRAQSFFSAPQFWINHKSYVHSLWPQTDLICHYNCWSLIILGYGLQRILMRNTITNHLESKWQKFELQRQGRGWRWGYW